MTCTTHHLACECREAKFAALQQAAQNMVNAWHKAQNEVDNWRDAPSISVYGLTIGRMRNLRDAAIDLSAVLKELE